MTDRLDCWFTALVNRKHNTSQDQLRYDGTIVFIIIVIIIIVIIIDIIIVMIIVFICQ